MFYLVKFSERYNYHINYEDGVYMTYFHDGGEHQYVGIIMKNLSNNLEMHDDDIMDIVESKLITLLYIAFSCKNINNIYSLSYPDLNLCDKVKGKVDIEQLLFHKVNEDIFAKIKNICYIQMQNIFYRFSSIFHKQNACKVNRMLEVVVKNIQDNEIYSIQIVPQQHFASMIKANLIKKFYKIHY